MHGARSRLATLLTVATLTTGLAACSSGNLPVAADGDESAPAAATRPAPTIDLGCDDLLDAATIDDALGGTAEFVRTARDGAGSYFWVSQIGAEQAGMLDCEWVVGSGSDEQYLEVGVLASAGEAWQLTAAEGPLMFVQSTPDRFGDASWDGCLSACFADVLVGDTWVAVTISQPDALDSVTEALVSTVSGAATLEPAWSTADVVAPNDCESLLPLATLHAEGSPDVQPWVKDDPVRTIHHGGFLAAGGVYCSWRNSFDSASAVTADLAVLPGGAWAWTEHFAQPLPDGYTREQVEGLGDEAWASCDDSGDCAVSVLSGETWISMEYRDEAGAGQRVKAIALANSVLTTITE